MLIIVGLGNPGEEFLGTRHNIGREFVQALQKKLELPDFRLEKKWKAHISEGKVGKEKILLVLPETYMNKSGSAVALASSFYKTKPNTLYIIHDDADIELGSAKLSFRKRSAGHKGVESVMRAVKSRDFWRFRIGIAGRKDIPAEKLVLKKFTPEEQLSLKKIKKRTIEAIISLIQEGPEKTMNEYNTT